jgi:glycosyltransferase involved in cell wall biosynthesis
MNLLIVSHTPHYLRDGELVGWGATVREIDQLGEIFDSVVHLAPLQVEKAPASAVPYASRRVRMRPVRAAGGVRFRDKLSILIAIPSYLQAMLAELRKADVVHVRCPANISLIALFLLSLLPYPRKRWIKYAGNWKPEGSEALSYRFQRWLLRRRWHRGVVTVNGEWPDQPSFVHTFLNPCLNHDELLEGRQLGIARQLGTPVRLIFAGQLETTKGVGRILMIIARLNELGVDATLDLVGDGKERSKFEQLACSLGIESQVRFLGWQPRSAMGQLYSRAHFILLPSNSEGWPKVLSEAMAFGVVPLASNVSSIPQYLERFDCGKSLDPENITSFADAIGSYLKHPEEWKRESENGQRAAELFGYDNYLKAVQKLLRLPSEIRPVSQARSEVFQPNRVA